MMTEAEKNERQRAAARKYRKSLGPRGWAEYMAAYRKNNGDRIRRRAAERRLENLEAVREAERLRYASPGFAKRRAEYVRNRRIQKKNGTWRARFVVSDKNIRVFSGDMSMVLIAKTHSQARAIAAREWGVPYKSVGSARVFDDE